VPPEGADLHQNKSEVDLPSIIPGEPLMGTEDKYPVQQDQANSPQEVLIGSKELK